MKFLVIATSVFALSIGHALAEHDEGHSDGKSQASNAQTHPGHQGYSKSKDNKGGGVPTDHFGAHGGPGYDSGPGGWGEAVSGAAKEGGIPGAHD